MSFVIAAPETVQAAAQDLAGIRSTLGEASASAAGSTTGIVAAAGDEVSAGVAALFGSFGQEYQVLSAQAQAFHEQFVNLLNAGAGTYLSTEAANAEQTLTNEVNAPGQALLGGAASGVGGGAATSSVSIGSIVAPYESLIANTAANLRSISNTWVHATGPVVLQAIVSQTGGPQGIITALESGNLPSITAVPGQLARGSANLIQALAVPVTLSITSLNPPNASVAIGLGLPQLLAFDALGAPVNASIAASASETEFFNAVQAGNPLGAFAALVDAPANIANAFLNGEQTLPITLPVPGLSLTVDVPFSGLLVAPQAFSTTTTLPGNPVLQTVTVTGPPIGGLVPALLEFAPELLATAFGG